MDCPATLEDLRAGGKRAMATALSAIEQHPNAREVLTLLDEAWEDPRAHVLGFTGPPGVGKSTLLNSLIDLWRESGRTVGVIAVDPSSRRSGGALLGDRTRFTIDPEDTGVFVRSMAARDRLGGLAAITYAASILMRAVYDLVVIETVGVGQSETEIAAVADTVTFCVQPGSGDSLQYMKAGVMEVPDIAVVTKADMGPAAIRARADVKGALSLTGEDGEDRAPVLLVSASTGDGLDKLLDAIDRRWADLSRTSGLEAARAAQGVTWLRDQLQDQFGRKGLAEFEAKVDVAQPPFSQWAALLND